MKRTGTADSGIRCVFLSAIWAMLLHFIAMLSSLSAQQTQTFLFVGSYTGAVPDTGIHVFRFDTQTGELTHTSSLPDLTNPSWINLSPDGKFLYACTETKLETEGSISAFAIDSIHGSLRFLNKLPSGGANPVYLSVYQDNLNLVNANYTSGNVGVFHLSGDGNLSSQEEVIPLEGSSVNPTRQEMSHPHSTVFSPDYRYLLVPDLGADLIRVYKTSERGGKLKLSPGRRSVKTLPGSGPRHLTFDPAGRFAYCIEELSGTISVYAYHEGELDSLQRVFSYSKTQDIYNSADIHVSPDGRFLYASNRWDEENTLSIWAIDSLTGLLGFVGHQDTGGSHPRNFCIDPSGEFLLVANQVTDNIVVFRRDRLTGLLTKTGEAHVQMPSSLQMRVYISR